MTSTGLLVIDDLHAHYRLARPLESDGTGGLAGP